MNKRVRKERKNIKRRNNKPVMTLFLTLLVAFTFVIGIKFVDVNAKKSDNYIMKREYISVEIEAGDTLWSLANEYMGLGYSDVDAYIDDIKSVNGIRSNTIHSGNYLIIPRYVAMEE